MDATRRAASALSADTKDALARDVPAAAHCRTALRAALLCYGGVVQGESVTFHTRRPAIARLLRALLDDRSAAATRKAAEPRLYRATTYEIDAPAHDAELPRTRLRCDRRMELRGAFLACGSLAAPARGYHLEFVVTDVPRTQRLLALIRAEGIEAKSLVRGRRHLVYLKGLDAIVAVLGAMGAYGAVLHLEDVRALKETKNRIHRLVNTETANVTRAASAAARQRESIAYLAESYGLRNLSPALREAAQLRLAHPDETLAELGRRASPPVSKATLNGRITTLLRLVRRLQADRQKGAAGLGG